MRLFRHEGKGAVLTVVELRCVDADLAALRHLFILAQSTHTHDTCSRGVTHVEHPLIPVLDVLLSDLVEHPVGIELLTRLDVVPRVGEEVRLGRSDDGDACRAGEAVGARERG